MIGCLLTRVRKQPTIALYLEFETVLKFYDLGGIYTTRVSNKIITFIIHFVLFFSKLLTSFVQKDHFSHTFERSWLITKLLCIEIIIVQNEWTSIHYW